MSGRGYSTERPATADFLRLNEIRDALDYTDEPEIVDVTMTDLDPLVSDNESEVPEAVLSPPLPEPAHSEELALGPPAQVDSNERSDNENTVSTPHGLALGRAPPNRQLYINHDHFNFAYLIGTWLQVLVNFAIVCGIAWLVLRLKQDVDLKLDERRLAIERNATYCAHEYLVNECRPGLRRPHLMEACQEWEECMDRDPLHIGWMSAHAATWAEIFNSFLDPLNWKALLTLVVTAFVLNWGLTRFRHVAAAQ